MTITSLLIFTVKNQKHFKAYKQALLEQRSIALKYLKFVLLGPPRSGKTSFLQRLVGDTFNLDGEPTQ